MPTRAIYAALQGSEHTRPSGDKKAGLSKSSQKINVTLVLRRAQRAAAVPNSIAPRPIRPLTRAKFAKTLGADPKDLAAVKAFAKANRLKVVLAHQARRSVELQGTVAAINQAFQLQLHDYQTARGRSYRSHEGQAHLPKPLANKVVECILGLDTRPIPATHYAVARRLSMDPPNTKSLTPLDIASLYEFPAGDGAGQTIGIYEMVTGEGPPGYAQKDVAATIKAFGGRLVVPTPADTAIDGTRNSGTTDPETLLDITVAGALAQKAKIAVYFTGENSANMVHALQRMIHPKSGDPVPTVISISYGWGLDTGLRPNLTANELKVIDDLFQDAASLSITVLVSTGDSGAKIESKTRAQASFPATDPWVIACGGTTLGNRKGLSFDEYVWNDSWNGGSGATGGGISIHFPVPSYQAGHGLPTNLVTKKPGRGIPDIAGNASPNSGYPQVIVGQGTSSGGGTSAVAPLYAGLIARINGNVGRSVGFVNPVLYSQAGALFRDVVGTPGPTSNSYSGVTGYPAGIGWDACTGFGSLKGTALQNALRKAGATGKRPKRSAQAKVFTSGAFAGVPVTDPFARAAARESPVIVDVGSIPWPSGLKPKTSPFGSYDAGSTITRPVQLDKPVDALIVLYTDNETRALLDVFTGNNVWSPARKKTWVGYGHNFAKFQPIIGGIKGDKALEQGIFGYLSCITIGTKNVVLYKSELHPKQNGSQLPFVPVMQQLIMELSPELVLSTGTAGAIGGSLNCGDVAITDTARFHCRDQYPNDPQIDTMSESHVSLTNRPSIDPQYVQLAASRFTRLSLPGLSRCYTSLQQVRGYSFVKKNVDAPSIYVTGTNPVPGPEPMAIVSADYLTVDDKSDAEKLQSLGIMNDTDDAFLFYAIAKLTSTKPKWLSVRNASEPQIVAPDGTSAAKMVDTIKGLAGRVYGIYQYCTTFNSAFACWGLIAGMK